MKSIAGTIASELAKASLLKEENNQFKRIIVEKPFGHDLASAQQLNTLLRAQFGKRTISDVVSGGRDDVMSVLRKAAEKQGNGKTRRSFI